MDWRNVKLPHPVFDNLPDAEFTTPRFLGFIPTVFRNGKHPQGFPFLFSGGLPLWKWNLQDHNHQPYHHPFHWNLPAVLELIIPLT
jgi:hypothetical protein